MIKWSLHEKKAATFLLGLVTLAIGISLVTYYSGDDVTRNLAIEKLKKNEFSCFPPDDPNYCFPVIKNSACAFSCTLHQNLLEPVCKHCDSLFIAGVGLIAASLTVTTAFFYRFANQEQAESQNKIQTPASIQMPSRSSKSSRTLDSIPEGRETPESYKVLPEN